MKIITGTVGSDKTTELCKLVAIESKKENNVNLIFDEETQYHYLDLLNKENADLNKIYMCDLRESPFYIFDLLEGKTIFNVESNYIFNTIFIDAGFLDDSKLKKLEELEVAKNLNIIIAI